MSATTSATSPMLTHYVDHLVAHDELRVQHVADLEHDVLVKACTYEGALSFITTICSSNRESPSKMRMGRHNDKRPSSKPAGEEREFIQLSKVERLHQRHQQFPRQDVDEWLLLLRQKQLTDASPHTARSTGVQIP